MTMRAVLRADNIVPLETLSADNMEGSKRFQFGAMALAVNSSLTLKRLQRLGNRVFS
jgi:hypothetical protein